MGADPVRMRLGDEFFLGSIAWTCLSIPILFILVRDGILLGCFWLRRPRLFFRFLGVFSAQRAHNLLSKSVVISLVRRGISANDSGNTSPISFRSRRASTAKFERRNEIAIEGI
jgi:hypothetical protein